MSDRTDDRLVEEHLAGDAHAFPELVRRYDRRAANLAWRLLGNTEDVEEVVQEAFLKAHLKIAELRAKNSFFPWFFAIVLNLCRERLRLKQRTTGRVPSRVSDRWEDSSVAELPDESAVPAWEAMEDREERRNLEEALAALPVKYRQVIALRCYEGLSYTEMAQVMNCRKRTVRWRLYRARQMLRRFLERLE